MQLINGSTQECWDHFRINIKNVDQDQLKKAFELVYSKPAEVESFDDLASGLPTGEDLLRLRYFLEFQGYEIKELKELAKPIYELGSAISFNELDLNEVTKKLGLVRKSLIRILRGIRGTSPEKLSAIQKILTDLVRQSHREAEIVRSSIPFVVAKEDIKHTFLHQVQAMIPIARLIISDDFTVEERRLIRGLSEKDGIFQLSNLLAAACTETARQRMIEETRIKQETKRIRKEKEE